MEKKKCERVEGAYPIPLLTATSVTIIVILQQVPENVKGGDLILAKCPDGTSVEVNVPDGLKPGDKFQLQVKQPQYNSENALLCANAAKGGTPEERENNYRMQQKLVTK